MDTWIHGYMDTWIDLGDSKNTLRGYHLDIPRFEESLNNRQRHKPAFEEQGVWFEAWINRILLDLEFRWQGFCKQGFSESWKCALRSCENLRLGITKPGFSHPGKTFFRSRENPCLQNPLSREPQVSKGWVSPRRRGALEVLDPGILTTRTLPTWNGCTDISQTNISSTDVYGSWPCPGRRGPSCPGRGSSRQRAPWPEQ